MITKKKKKSLQGVHIATNPDEQIVLTPPWETKLKEKFAFSNNPGRWSDRQSVDEVVAFIKEELNAPIEQYKKDLAKVHSNKIRIAITQLHGGGNGRRILTQLLADIDSEK